LVVTKTTTTLPLKAKEHDGVFFPLFSDKIRPQVNSPLSDLLDEDREVLATSVAPVAKAVLEDCNSLVDFSVGVFPIA